MSVVRDYSHHNPIDASASPWLNVAWGARTPKAFLLNGFQDRLLTNSDTLQNNHTSSIPSILSSEGLRGCWATNFIQITTSLSVTGHHLWRNMIMSAESKIRTFGTRFVQRLSRAPLSATQPSPHIKNSFFFFSVKLSNMRISVGAWLPQY